MEQDELNKMVKACPVAHWADIWRDEDRTSEILASCISISTIISQQGWCILHHLPVSNNMVAAVLVTTVLSDGLRSWFLLKSKSK
jgi:hypothetical protein